MDELMDKNASAGRRWRIVLNAPAVLGFVGLCVCATVLNYLTGGLANRLVFSTYRSSPLDPFTYLRLLTHVLGHANWDHLIANMSYILLLGPLLEEKYGSRTIIQIICLTAVATGLVNSLLYGHVALCGASGVCFAFILLSSVTSFGEGQIPLTFVLVAVLFLGQQLVDALFVTDNVSNLSHILGGIVGGMAGFALAKPTSAQSRLL